MDKFNTMENIITTLKEKRKTNNSNLIIVLPTYNEIENIESFIKTIISKINSNIYYQILVIDDNSPDGTKDAVINLMTTISNLNIFINPEKKGLGAAYKKAFHIAINAGFDFLISLDSDFSHDPIVINTMMQKINDYDCIIGSRYINGGKVVNFQKWRLFISKGGNNLAKFLTNISLKDCTSGFRCYKMKKLSKINFKKTKLSDHYIFLMELLTLLVIKNSKIFETPITFINREKGKTKINIYEMFHGFFTILKLRYKFNKNKYL